MATPHVAGVIAYLIGKDGNITPAAMATKLKSLSTKNALTGVREYLGLSSLFGSNWS